MPPRASAHLITTKIASDLRDIVPFIEWLRHSDNFRSVEKRRWRQFKRAGAR